MASTNTRLSTLGDRGCKFRDDMVEKENNEDRGAHGHRHSMLFVALFVAIGFAVIPTLLTSTTQTRTR
jgi:hypothetical protein